MTTYGVTPSGFIVKPFDVIRQEVEDYQRDNIDSGLDLSDDSRLGQVNVAHVLKLSEVWDNLQAMNASFDPATATDWSLDQLASLTGTYRTEYSKTLVTAQVTLNPDKALPAGSLANLSNRPNSVFVSLTEVPADPGGGTFDVVFEAREAGTIEVAIGQLDEINVAVSGWTAVDNAAVGTPGGEPESDPVFELKRISELQVSGSSNLDAVRAGVRAVTNVVDVKATQNRLGIVANGLPPNSVAVTVRGGTAADVAAAIEEEIATGITTVGTTTVTVTDSEGIDDPISFTPATSLTFYCTTVIDKDSQWNGATSIAEVKEAIAAYVNSLNIGDYVIYDKVRAAVMSVTGVHQITSLYMDFSASPTGVINLIVSDTEYAESDVANIGVTAP